MLFFQKGARPFHEAMKTSDKAEKVRLLQEAAALGHGQAAYELAKEYGEQPYLSDSECIRQRGAYYVQAANAGMEMAYEPAADALVNGVGVEKDCTMACSFYQKAYARFHMAAVAYKLARLYEEQGQYGEALPWAEKAKGYKDGEGLQEQLNKMIGWEKLSAEELTEKADELFDHKELEDSFLMFKQAATRGNARAAYCLGVDYYSGKGTEKDYDAAYRWLHQAELADYRWAFFNLGIAFYDGNGVPADRVKAASYFEKAEAFGDTRAYYRLGELCRTGEGMEKDLDKARDYYRKSIENNRRVGAASYGLALLEQELCRYQEALEWAQKADKLSYPGCKSLVSEIQMCLVQADSTNAERFQQALLYTITGHKAEAFTMFNELAQMGHREALRELAICYDRGRGVPQDKRKAVDCYDKLARLGDKSVYFRIAQAYHKGEGRYQSYSDALRWYKESYERFKKDMETVHNIVECYLKKALPGAAILVEGWIDEAERLGDPSVPNMKRQCENLSILQSSSDARIFAHAEKLFNNGHPAEAFALYQKAAEAGYKAAKERLLDYDPNGVYRKDLCVMRRQNFEELVASQSLNGDAVKKVTDRFKDKDAQTLFDQAIAYGQMAFRSDSEEEKNNYKAYSFIVYKMAADKGHKLASRLTAQIYEEGDCGVKANKYLAFLYYLQAAEGGDQKAYFPVGMMYLEGIAVDRDVDKAIRWLTKCAEWPDLAGAHSDIAAYRLAEIYCQRKMLSKAMTWAQKAKAFRYKPAEELEDLINRIRLADTHETYHLVLNATGENRAQVMAKIRLATGWSLAEIMERTKHLPATIMSAAPEKEAEDLCAALIKYGANVELTQVD